MDYGLPEPDHKLAEAHPTISSDLLPRIGHGDIAVKPNIAEFARRADGRASPTASEEEIDLVVYCTGYKISFPFFDRELISAPDNEIPLYRRVVSPEHPGPLLHRPAAAAGGDHAARRGAVGVDRRRARGQGRAARAPSTCSG